MSQSEGILKVLRQNRAYVAHTHATNPHLFESISAGQAPQYLWLGCADSRVLANEITGLEPGELFVHRNVGNLAQHSDMNCMSAIEYAVQHLKVKHIIVCGHYDCGAVKGALTMPSKTLGMVNCWISSIRDVRNVYAVELQALTPQKQHDRLCELNVVRQFYNVCTSSVVQAAWDAGQQLHIHGLIYRLSDGILQPLVGPITNPAEADAALTDQLQPQPSVATNDDAPTSPTRPDTPPSPCPLHFSFVAPTHQPTINEALDTSSPRDDAPPPPALAAAAAALQQHGCKVCAPAAAEVDIRKSGFLHNLHRNSLQAHLKDALKLHQQFEVAGASPPQN